MGDNIKETNNLNYGEWTASLNILNSINVKVGDVLTIKTIVPSLILTLLNRYKNETNIDIGSKVSLYTYIPMNWTIKASFNSTFGKLDSYYKDKTL